MLPYMLLVPYIILEVVVFVVVDDDVVVVAVLPVVDGVNDEQSHMHAPLENLCIYKVGNH